MKKKFLSVIIVSLNTKRDFLKTLKSCLNQNKKDIEIIVIDGKSTDGTVKEILKYKKKIFKIRIQKDKGIYDAMNKGIKLATGKWIIFMNSGDVFYNKNVTKNLSNFCSKYKNNNKIVFGNTILLDKYDSYQLSGNYFKNSTILMPFCHQSSLVNSGILKKKLFDTKFNYSSDFNFFLNCYLNNVKYKKFNNFISKVKSGGKSDKFRQKVLSENIKIFFKNKSYIKIIFLIYMKLFVIIKITTKLCLPNKFVKYLLKIKYQKIKNIK